MKCIVLIFAALAACQSWAQTQTVALTCNDMSRFNTTEIRAKAGDTLVVVYKNVGRLQSMRHNLVILKPNMSADQFGNAAMNAKAEDYVPTHQRDKVLAFTGLLGIGESETIRVKLSEPGRYEYLCSYPGHFSISKGVLIVE